MQAKDPYFKIKKYVLKAGTLLDLFNAPGGFVETLTGDHMPADSKVLDLAFNTRTRLFELWIESETFPSGKYWVETLDPKTGLPRLGEY
jgi:hypothetical protein